MTASTTRSRKFKAILAGGIVLGIGAAVTLAAWTDDEWAEGVFGAGSFNVEGSTDGTAFTDHESADGAASLDFELPASDNLSPGDAVAAPFVLRLDESTTYDATVDLTSAAGTGSNATNLSYGIVQVANAGACTVGAAGTQIVPSGTPLSSTTGKQGFSLTAGADDAAGEPVTLCFTVTAGNDLTEGENATAQWQFTATSVD
ncbi:SipW-dependent-type signal peptide-containing protein [Brevibacterium atlanticum]|uniref:SipW-dependent-type signal peptide-containing protein n=1 Tax=Brevibacterium atlanticum TaxID=2697563 RepID=UPI001424345E|nr:SipW-dependent-type signal peptide-containing protein [Brevibacterium atlanticum]